MAITAGIDSYVTLEEADAYFSRLLNSDAWDNADIIKKEKALKNASLNIDKLQFAGRKADLNQPLQFPRDYADIIPEDVKFAVYEEALFLLMGGSKRIELQEQGVKSFSLGDLSESFNEKQTIQPVSPKALRYLKKYLLGSVAIC